MRQKVEQKISKIIELKTLSDNYKKNHAKKFVCIYIYSILMIISSKIMRYIFLKIGIIR